MPVNHSSLPAGDCRQPIHYISIMYLLVTCIISYSTRIMLLNVLRYLPTKKVSGNISKRGLEMCQQISWIFLIFQSETYVIIINPPLYTCARVVYLIVELEGVQEVVERMEIGLFQVVSDDGQDAAVHVTTSQSSTVRPHMDQFTDAVFLGRRTVAERVLDRHIQRVANSARSVITE